MQALDAHRYGQLDTDEWEVARRRNQSEAYIQSLHKKHEDAWVAPVLRPSDDKRLPYPVATHRESETLLLQGVYA